MNRDGNRQLNHALHVVAVPIPRTPGVSQTASTRPGALQVFLVLAAFTGARRAQLLGLRWHSVHFETGRVSFCAGWVEGPHGPVLTSTKTKHGHVVDLDPATCQDWPTMLGKLA